MLACLQSYRKSFRIDGILKLFLGFETLQTDLILLVCHYAARYRQRIVMLVYVEPNGQFQVPL